MTGWIPFASAGPIGDSEPEAAARPVQLRRPLAPELERALDGLQVRRLAQAPPEGRLVQRTAQDGVAVPAQVPEHDTQDCRYDEVMVQVQGCPCTS